MSELYSGDDRITEISKSITEISESIERHIWEVAGQREIPILLIAGILEHVKKQFLDLIYNGDNYDPNPQPTSEQPKR